MSVKKFIKAVATAFPKTGIISEVLTYNEELYRCYPARYGFEGFYFKPNPLADATGAENFISISSEKDEKDGDFKFNFKGFKINRVEQVKLKLDVFKYQVTDDRERYRLVKLDDLVAEVDVIFVRGFGQTYKYHSVPSWMFSVKKKLQMMYPDLYVAIDGSKWRCIKVVRLIKVKIRNVQVIKTVSRPIIREEKSKKKIDEVDKRIKGFLASLELE